MFYRCIKPSWGKPTLNEEANPDFIREIKGPNVYEGYFDSEYIKERNAEGYNVYFFPNHPSTNVYTDQKRFLNGKDIDVFNFVFVDMDLKDKVYKTKEEFYHKLSSFPLKPTMTIDSGNGVHAYWAIKDLTRESYVITQLALINHFNTDDSIWTVLQLMRVPDSINTKICDNPKQVSFNSDLSCGNSYNLSELPQKIFDLPKELITKANNHIARLDGKVEISLHEDVNLNELPESFISMLYDKETIYQLFTNPKEYYGDRSSADMKLTNLLFSAGLSKKDALATIANSQKALSKGPSRYDYAITTIDKVYVDRTENKFMSVGQKIRRGIVSQSGDPVNGPIFFDCLYHGWMKKQVLGLIGGSGIGKTSVTLKMIKDMIENNAGNDDVFIFFTLEMPEIDIIEKWIQLVGETSPLADRLYVIGNEDDNGDPRNIGLQEILQFSEDVKTSTGKNIGSVAIDHVGILSPVINIKKGIYNFGVEQEGGWGDVQTLSVNNLCTQLKVLAKMLDTFLIVLTQTTKAKGAGDTPIDKDGAYGVSQYENIMDYIITVWQPLMRVQPMCDHYFLAWQYAKIRQKHRADGVQTHQQKLLYYEMETGNLRKPDEEEYRTFLELLPQATEARKNVEQKKSNDYSLSITSEELNELVAKVKLMK